MGRVREFAEEEEEARATLSEALLLTTICIVGLPVEVYVKDGSIFSGIFHTASLHNGYGIALKKAQMVKKGTHSANVVNGCLIDTLVVHPDDLVQVIAKGVMLPPESASSDATTYDGANSSLHGSENGVVSADEQLIEERHVRMGRSQEEDSNHHASQLIKELIEVNHTTTNMNGRHTPPNAHSVNQAMADPSKLINGSLIGNGTSRDVKVTTQLYNKEPARTKSGASEVSTSDNSESDGHVHNSVPVPTAVAPQNHVTNRTAKESKLNPGAKIFSPSLPNFRSNPTPPPTVPSVAYVTNSMPAVQVATPQSDIGIRSAASRSLWPVKGVPYVTSAPATADNGLQYSQPIAAHTTRTQPGRHGAVYSSVQPVPSFLHANHQHGMFGRPGQFVYMHPITHDVIQAPATLSQAPHPLLTSHPLHVAKHEGILAGQALQASMTPPLIANVPQPYMMPTHHIQFSQPLFSSMRPVPILSPTVPYGAKFP